MTKKPAKIVEVVTAQDARGTHGDYTMRLRAGRKGTGKILAECRVWGIHNNSVLQGRSTLYDAAQRMGYYVIPTQPEWVPDNDWQEHLREWGLEAR